MKVGDTVAFLNLPIGALFTHHLNADGVCPINEKISDGYEHDSCVVIVTGLGRKVGKIFEWYATSYPDCKFLGYGEECVP